jgi:hypothetical protein
VVSISAELTARMPPGTTLIDGIPVLVVEILSPNDTQEEIDEKIDTYLAAGVALVWVINPHHRTVNIFRPGMERGVQLLLGWVFQATRLVSEPSRHFPGASMAATAALSPGNWPQRGTEGAMCVSRS